MRRSHVSFSLLFFAVAFGACNNGNVKSTEPATAAQPSATSGGQSMRLAWVNIDSLEAHYELLKTKKEQFKQHQEQMEGELERSFQQMQREAAEYQKKAESGLMTRTEGEAAEKHMMQMRQSLETRKQALTEQLMKEQDAFNKDLKARLDAFLENYNKEHHYDYILSNGSSASAILYANKQYDITKEVVDGMNALSKTDAEKK